MTHSKTDAGRRTIDLSPVLRDELAGHRAGARYAAPCDRVFPTASGGAHDRNNIRDRILAKAVECANVRLADRGLSALPDGLTPHSLRHTFASLLVRAGHDPAYVMAQLGHTDPAVTLGIYAHALRQPSDAGARLDALVAGSIGHSLGTSPDSDGRDLTASMAAGSAETPCEQGFPPARPRGFEPLTSRSGGGRSIH